MIRVNLLLVTIVGSLRDAVSKTEHDRRANNNPEHLRRALSQTRDQVEYIADLLLELKEMAGGHGFATLAGILDLAHAEARVQAGSRYRAGHSGVRETS